MNIAVDLNGVTSIQELGFYVPGNGGGFAIEGIPDYAFNGPQLITTQLYTPFPNFLPLTSTRMQPSISGPTLSMKLMEITLG